ncbi:MAG: Trp biosynthesis-associated membrane protein [Microbacteriaceae bacterium]|nr:Trp biosynthesis-associated membrane protein [Microbacteriaceae bacterium]
MTGRTGKRLALLLLLAGAGLGMLAWTQPWAALRLADGTELAGAGADASPGTMALSAAALAAVAALAIAGPVFRRIMGGLAVAIGALAVWVALAVDPFRALGAEVRRHTALADDPAVREAIEAGTGGLTAWPVVAAIGGAVVAIAGAVAIATAGRWPASGRRYSSTRLAADPAEPESRVDQWDALSAGEDPTGAEPDGDAPDPRRAGPEAASGDREAQ